MRLIADHLDEHHARFFSSFLTEQKIYNLCERAVTDADRATVFYRIWVEREEQVARARKWYADFQKNSAAFQLQHSIAALQQQDSVELSSQHEFSSHPKNVTSKYISPTIYFGHITTRLIILCCMLFVLSNTWQYIWIETSSVIEHTLLSPIEKGLLYDYPAVADLYEQLTFYSSKAANESDEAITKVAKDLLSQIQNTPHWQSFYALLFQQGQQPHFSWQQLGQSIEWSLACEKIQSGQLWRLITPCLLHYSFVHLVFNMLWILILGGQIEERLLSRRFVILLVLIALISNSCQYFMGGWNFLGISGVVSGLAGFIWMRQRIAKDEHYPLERSVISFIAIFIAASFLWEVYTFFGTLFHWPSFPLGIANTAHITGAVSGVLLGYLSFFKISKEAVTFRKIAHMAAKNIKRL